MCINCGDFVDMCFGEGCYNPNGGAFSRARKFYVGDTYCVHLLQKYGHTLATFEDQERPDE